MRAGVPAIHANVGPSSTCPDLAPIPTNRNVPLPGTVPDLTDVKLINYDFAKYGSSETRKRLLARWESEINTGGK